MRFLLRRARPAFALFYSFSLPLLNSSSSSPLSWGPRDRRSANRLLSLTLLLPKLIFCLGFSLAGRNSSSDPSHAKNRALAPGDSDSCFRHPFSSSPLHLQSSLLPLPTPDSRLRAALSLAKNVFALAISFPICSLNSSAPANFFSARNRFQNRTSIVFGAKFPK